MERETQDRSVFLKIYTTGTWITVSMKVKWQEQNKFRPWETFSKPVLTKSSLLASCPSSLLLFSWSPHPIPPLMLPYYLFHFPFLGDLSASPLALVGGSHLLATSAAWDPRASRWRHAHTIKNTLYKCTFLFHSLWGGIFAVSLHHASPWFVPFHYRVVVSDQGV